MQAFPDPFDYGHVDARKLPDARVVPSDVLDAYGLNGASVMALDTRSFNIHFRVDSNRGGFDLRRSNRPIDRSNLAFETEFLDHLRSKGFDRAPRPVPTLGGAFNYWSGSSGWTLLEWEDSANADADMLVTDGRIDSAADTLARIHTAMTDFVPTERRGDWPIFSRPEEWADRWAARTAQLAGHLGDEAQDLLDISGQATAEIASVDFTRLPTIGCHADYRMRNVRFAGDEVSIVFDFDTAMMSTRLLDLGGAVTRFSRLAPDDNPSTPQADVASGSRFLRTYNEASPLIDYEWQVLPYFIGWRLVRDATIYFDRWWTKIGDTCRELYSGAALEMVTAARD